ncbi:hypothetical protein RQM59_13900 [Flavobacteriaceae bacterium S356]|uniref:DUF3888 domain-containing protein n=1 Tax=Asprobacillus argus TaxID=3076534 RepID=A0ABU3LIL9_9FLAO|nr:hypothetical protein [Flavobacteriaceae bacterium S356]
MKKILFVFALFVGFLVQSQEKPSVNSFKYVIVPVKLDFLNEPDQYQTSSLSKFLFEKSGFKAYLSNEVLPKDLSKDRCLALTANILRKSAFLATKIYIELLDCRNNVVFKTDVFGTKEKKYTKAYREVLRNAFKPIMALNYLYQPSNDHPEKRIETPKKEKTEVKPKTTVVVMDDIAKLPRLTAKPIKNGFDLVDSKSMGVYQILKTKTDNVFIIKGKNGTMYKEGNYWVAEFYNTSNELVKKKYVIVF